MNLFKSEAAWLSVEVFNISQGARQVIDNKQPCAIVIPAYLPDLNQIYTVISTKTFFFLTLEFCI